jgi:hypothetical protein
MDHSTYPDAYIRDIFADVTTIAMAGASTKPARASFRVMQFLLEQGYQVCPVNPAYAGQEIHGQEVVAGLADVPFAIDMVDIFRNSEDAGKTIEEALTLEQLPKVIWMQLGVRNEAAARAAEERGIRVVMDRCPKIEIPRLSIPAK